MDTRARCELLLLLLLLLKACNVMDSNEQECRDCSTWHTAKCGNEASIVSIARHSAMAASHAQAQGANRKLSACFSQMFGILVSCGHCASFVDFISKKDSSALSLPGLAPLVGGGPPRRFAQLLRSCLHLRPRSFLLSQSLCHRVRPSPPLVTS